MTATAPEHGRALRGASARPTGASVHDAAATELAGVDPGRAGSARPGRVVAVDQARGAALLGMVAVHVVVEQWPWLGHFSGRAAVVFVLVSGLTLSLLAGRGSASATPAVLRRRGAVLLVVGLVLANTVWAPAILHYYGVLFLLAPWLLRWSSRALLVLAGLALTLGPVAVVLGVDATGGIDSWTPPARAVVGTAATMLFDRYALCVWVGFFAAGLVLGRLPLDRRLGARLVLGGLVLAGLATGVSHLLPAYEPAPASAAGEASGAAAADAGVRATTPGPATSVELPGTPADWSSLNDLRAHSNRTPWALQALGIAGAVVGGFLLLPEWAAAALAPLAALGSVSLSAYLLHIFLVQGGWRALGAVDHPDRQPFAFLFLWLVLLAGAWLVRRRFRQGPAEWALHHLTRPRAARQPIGVQ